MAANPISFQEIEAYSRLTFAVISPWEVDLLRRVDVAALAAAQKRSARKKSGEPEPKFEAEASDGAAVKALLRGFSSKSRK